MMFVEYLMFANKADDQFKVSVIGRGIELTRTWNLQVAKHPHHLGIFTF